MAPDWEKLGLAPSEIEPLSREANFTKMDWGTIRPTDFDAVIEYHDFAFLLVEFKGEGAPVLKGQALALERAADALWQAGRYVLFVLCEVPCNIAKDDNGQFDPRECVARHIRLNGEDKDVIPFDNLFGDLFERWKAGCERIAATQNLPQRWRLNGVLAGYNHLCPDERRMFLAAVQSAS